MLTLSSVNEISADRSKGNTLSRSVMYHSNLYGHILVFILQITQII
jgi:hypothetical protein